MNNLFSVSFRFISGVMLGIELAEDEDYNYAIIDLLIVEIVVDWNK